MNPKDPRTAAVLNELSEYYGVTPEQALELGTRSPGRRPDLPGSMTCVPVSGKTMEDIWDAAPRDTLDGIWGFYKELGAWASFRQCVRHLDMFDYHASVVSALPLAYGCHIVEYGCGVAPYAWSLLADAALPQDASFSLSLSDVPCEHFEFAKWRLRRMVARRRLSNVALSFVDVTPDALPRYDKAIDAAIVFEVLEHVPDPHAAIKNLVEQMRSGGVLVENFIQHEHDDKCGPDLESARQKRAECYEFIEGSMLLVSGKLPSVAPNMTRAWKKQ